MDKKDIKILIVSLAVLSQYDTKIYLQIPGEEPEVKDLTLQDVADFEESLKQGIDVQIKPYLRSMSSMTAEEICKIENIIGNCCIFCKDGSLNICTEESISIPVSKMNELIQFMYLRHLDINGLIPMGLALEVPEGMY